MTPDGNGGLTLIGDTDPLGDVCSTLARPEQLAGKNIGDLLNAKDITWGWFEGGFDLTMTNANGTTGCARETDPTAPQPGVHLRRLYPASPAVPVLPSHGNPTHARPSLVAAIGHSTVPGTNKPDPANHQYDITRLLRRAGGRQSARRQLPEGASFRGRARGLLRSAGRAAFPRAGGQRAAVRPEWRETAVVIAYDDSDGWYDHQTPPIVNPSTSPSDALNGAGRLQQRLRSKAARRRPRR